MLQLQQQFAKQVRYVELDAM